MINGTWQHFIMGIATVFCSFWWFGHAYEAAFFMLAIEATQIDIFKLRGRVLDTAVDLLADAVGGLIGYVIFINIIPAA